MSCSISTSWVGPVDNPQLLHALPFPSSPILPVSGVLLPCVEVPQISPPLKGITRFAFGKRSKNVITVFQRTLGGSSWWALDQPNFIRIVSAPLFLCLHHLHIDKLLASCLDHAQNNAANPLSYRSLTGAPPRSTFHPRHEVTSFALGDEEKYWFPMSSVP